MAITTVGVSEDIMNEFRLLVFQKYQKYGYLRTEVDKALKKRIEELKQELASSV